MIRINAGDRQLVVPTEVVSHNVGPHFEPDSHGMRLRFLDTDEATRHKIEELCERSLLQDAPTRESE